MKKRSHSVTFCKSSSAFCICNYACLATWSHQTSWQTSPWSSLLLKASNVRSSCSRLCLVQNHKGQRIHSLPVLLLEGQFSLPKLYSQLVEEMCQGLMKHDRHVYPLSIQSTCASNDKHNETEAAAANAFYISPLGWHTLNTIVWEHIHIHTYKCYKFTL